MRTIYLKPKSDFPYIGTEVPFDRSVNEIKALLRKFNCDEILMHEKAAKNGTEYKLAFKKEGVPYIIEFPIVYIEGPRTPARIAMNVSGRIVFNSIKNILLDVEIGAMSFMQGMMRHIPMVTAGGTVPLGDLIEAQKDRIIRGEIEFDPSKVKLLQEATDAKK